MWPPIGAPPAVRVLCKHAACLARASRAPRMCVCHLVHSVTTELGGTGRHLQQTEGEPEVWGGSEPAEATYLTRSRTMI